MDTQGDDLLICPHCNYTYDEQVSEVRVKEGFGIENADREQCEDCNEIFLIIEYDGYYAIEIPEDEDVDEDIDEDEDDD